MRAHCHPPKNPRRFHGIIVGVGALALLLSACGSTEKADGGGWSVTPSANGTCIEEGAGGDGVCRTLEAWQDHARAVCAQHNLMLSGVDPVERCDASTDPNGQTTGADGQGFSKVRFTCCAGPIDDGGTDPHIAICEGMELIADQCVEQQAFQDYAQRACARNNLSVRALRPLEACATGDAQMRRAYLICCDDQVQPPPPGDRCTTVRGETQTCVDRNLLADLAERACAQQNMKLREVKPLEQCTDASGQPNDPATGEALYRNFEAVCCADSTVPPPPPPPPSDCRELEQMFDQCVDEQQAFALAQRLCAQQNLLLTEAKPIEGQNCQPTADGQRAGFAGVIARCCADATVPPPPPPPVDQCQQIEKRLDVCVDEQGLWESAKGVCDPLNAIVKDVRGIAACDSANGLRGFSAIAVTCCVGDPIYPPPPPYPEPRCEEIKYADNTCLDKQTAWAIADKSCRDAGLDLMELVPFDGCASSAGNIEGFTGFYARCCDFPDATTNGDASNQP